MLLAGLLLFTHVEVWKKEKEMKKSGQHNLVLLRAEIIQK
jgi:hypothetical protein